MGLINYAAVRNAAQLDTISAKKAATASQIAEEQEAVCINIGVIKTALVTSWSTQPRCALVMPLPHIPRNVAFLWHSTRPLVYKLYQHFTPFYKSNIRFFIVMSRSTWYILYIKHAPKQLLWVLAATTETGVCQNWFGKTADFSPTEVRKRYHNGYV